MVPLLCRVQTPSVPSIHPAKGFFVAIAGDATTSCTLKSFVLNHEIAQVDPKLWFQHPQAHPPSSPHQNGHSGSCFSSCFPQHTHQESWPGACFGAVTEGAAAPPVHRAPAACELPPEDVTSIKNAHSLLLIPAKPQAEPPRRLCLSVCVSISINIISIDTREGALASTEPAAPAEQAGKPQLILRPGDGLKPQAPSGCWDVPLLCLTRSCRNLLSRLKKI